MAMLVAACSDGGDSPTAPATPDVGPFPMVEVPVAVDSSVGVSPVSFVSAFDSAQAIASDIAIPDDPDGVLIFAVNSAGDPLLSAVAVPGQPVVFSAEGTVAALVHAGMILLTRDTPVPFAWTLPQVQAHPASSAVAERVRELAAAGTSYLDDDGVMDTAAEIAVEIAREVGGEIGVAASISPLAFAGTRVEVGDAQSTSFQLRNRTRLRYAITMQGEREASPGPAFILSDPEVQFLGILPVRYDTYRDTTVGGVDGKTTFRVFQNGATKAWRTKEATTDVVGAILKGLGIGSEKAGQAPRALAVGITEEFWSVVGPSNLEAIAEEPAQQAVVIIVDLAWSHRGSWVPHAAREVGSSVGLSGTAKLIGRTLGKLLLVAEYSAMVVERGPFWSDWALYGNVDESLEVCQENGEFGPCLGGTYLATMTFTDLEAHGPQECTVHFSMEVTETDNPGQPWNIQATTSGSKQECTLRGELVNGIPAWEETHWISPAGRTMRGVKGGTEPGGTSPLISLVWTAADGTPDAAAASIQFLLLPSLRVGKDGSLSAATSGSTWGFTFEATRI